jgi:signal peptidase II
MVRKPHLFWPIFFCLVLTDCATKRLAVERLTPPHVPHPVVDDILRFTLAYNRGAATGIPLGGSARWLLAALTLAALIVIARLYRSTAPADRWRVLALALVSGGAVGNLVDRIRWDRGVVDFIDVGVGTLRFWTFNVADIGVTLGAVLLALLLWRSERGRAPHTPPSHS